MDRSARIRAAAAAGFLLASSCGYSFGSGLPAAGVRTVALTVVGNETSGQRLEAELSAALARELPISSDLRLSDRARADAILEVVRRAAIRTMTEATRQSGITPADIDYINSHGTDTPFNDVAEAQAITAWAG